MYVHFFSTRRMLIVFSSFSLMLSSCFNSGGGTSGGSNQSSTTQNTGQNTSSIQDESQVQAQRVNQQILTPTPVNNGGPGLPSLAPPKLKMQNYSPIGNSQSYQCDFVVTNPSSPSLATSAPTYFANGKLCLASDRDTAGNTVGCANDDILVGPRKKLEGSSLNFTGYLPPVTIDTSHDSSNVDSLNQYSVICKSRLFHAPKDSGAPVHDEPTAKKFLPVFRLPAGVFGDFAIMGSCTTGAVMEQGKQTLELRRCKFTWKWESDVVRNSIEQALSSIGYNEDDIENLNACISIKPYTQNNPPNNASAQYPTTSQVKCAPFSEIMNAGIQLEFSASGGYRLPADVGNAPKFSYSLWLKSPQHVGPDQRAHTYAWSNKNAHTCENQDMSINTCGISQNSKAPILTQESKAPLINGGAQTGNYLLH